MPGLRVYGGDDRVDSITKKVSHSNNLKVRCSNCVFSSPNISLKWSNDGFLLTGVVLSQIGSLNVKCLFTPCHTTGHICYYVTKEESSEPPAVFTGTWDQVGWICNDLLCSYLVLHAVLNGPSRLLQQPQSPRTKLFVQMATFFKIRFLVIIWILENSMEAMASFCTCTCVIQDWWTTCARSTCMCAR